MRNKKRTTYTSKEIAVSLNNAVGASSNSIATVSQGEDKKRRIRNYTMELALLLKEDVDEGFLKIEELVQALASAALFLQCAYVLKSVKLPYMENMMKEELEDDGTRT